MNYEYCDGMTHTIRQGETLYSLSRQYNVPLAIILRANPYIDVYNLQIGDTICIPVKNQGQPGGGNCNGCGTGVIPGGSCKDDDDDDDDKDDIDDDDDYKDNDDDDDDDKDDNDKDYNNVKDARYNNGTGIKTDMGLKRNIGLKMDTDTGYMAGYGVGSSRNNTGNGIGNHMENNIINSMENNSAMGGLYTMGGMAAPVRNQKEGIWVKYVAQAGDTLQDILDKSEGTTDMFWEKNQAGKMYMLPGVAYFILENSTD